MEIIIIVALLALALWWFFLREAPAKTETLAAYKVETPPVAEPAPAPVAEVKVEEPTPVVEERAAPRLDPVAIALDMTPVVMTAKKPRKPRAPKAAAPVAKATVVKEKAPAKAKAPKVAAKTPAKKPAARTVKSKKI